MPKKTHGLGRGLDSLFAGAEDWGTSIQEIPVGELDPNPDQPRRTFSAESISQLADSIREQGVLQPLLVAPASGSRYMIIAGERRYRAGREAGLETLPCIVKDIDVIRQREIALIENLQREDLNPIEAAKGIRALMDQCGYTQEKVSTRLGKSRPAVANMLRLLQLPDEVTEMVRDGLLTAGHARVLAGSRGGRAERAPDGAAGEDYRGEAEEKSRAEAAAGRTGRAAGKDPPPDRTEEHSDGKHFQGPDRAAVQQPGRT